jgi:hypothetical protein
MPLPHLRLLVSDFLLLQSDFSLGLVRVGIVLDEAVVYHPELTE